MDDVVAQLLPAPAATRCGRAERLLAVPGTLPLVAVAGSRGKSTTAWMLDGIVRAAGYTNGAWLSSGVHVNGELQAGELGPWTDVIRRARAGQLNLVLQEMDAATVVAAG